MISEGRKGRREDQIQGRQSHVWEGSPVPRSSKKALPSEKVIHVRPDGSTLFTRARTDMTNPLMFSQNYYNWGLFLKIYNQLNKR